MICGKICSGKTTYANKLRKGGLGNLLEEVFFGYKANSNQEADFAEAGVELKVTPYEVKKRGNFVQVNDWFSP